MNHSITILLGFIILSSCTYQPKEKRLSKFGNNNSQILKSLYKTSNDTIEFKRILVRNSEVIVQSGEIFLGEYALTNQRFKKTELLINYKNTIDSLTTRFMNEGFVAKFIDKRDVMFIQIVPDSAMDNIDYFRFLNLRQEVEEQIDERLKVRNLGEWLAGDMGAGGNMLFFVDDWNSSMNTIIEFLEEEDLIDHVLIAKRIMTSKEDWNYEIVYPVEYEGVFNHM